MPHTIPKEVPTSTGLVPVLPCSSPEVRNPPPRKKEEMPSSDPSRQTPVLSFLTERTVAGTVRKEGFVLYPTKVVVFSTTSTSETLQGVGLCENVITHIGVVIQKSYNGLQGKNLVSIYINGIPNVAFSFDSGDTFGSASFTAGQSATDFYLYMMRVYDFPLEGQAMFNNFLNAIFEGTQISRGEYDRESTRDANDILGAAGIDYQLAVQLGYNCMVIEPDDPEAPIPDFYHRSTVRERPRSDTTAGTSEES